MKRQLSRFLRRFLTHPPSAAMSVDNVYAYLDALYHKRNVPGPVVEIGVADGGASALAIRFLERIGCAKPYYLVDTFDGIVEDQLATDHQLGLSRRHDRMFKGNSVARVKENLAKWGITGDIHFVQGDICTLSPESLPDNISVCLLDVDLRDPIYKGLHRLVRKMAPDGIIVVDDCKNGTSWVGADVGYRDFLADQGWTPKYYMGFGVVEFTRDPATCVPWQLEQEPNRVPEPALAST